MCSTIIGVVCFQILNYRGLVAIEALLIWMCTILMCFGLIILKQTFIVLSINIKQRGKQKIKYHSFFLISQDVQNKNVGNLSSVDLITKLFLNGNLSTKFFYEMLSLSLEQGHKHFIVDFLCKIEELNLKG